MWLLAQISAVPERVGQAAVGGERATWEPSCLGSRAPMTSWHQATARLCCSDKRCFIIPLRGRPNRGEWA